MSLKITRALITAALEGDLENVNYETHEIFGLNYPTKCEGVPSDLLSPRNTWTDKAAYDKKANELATKFNNNFKQFADNANDEILAASPICTENA